MGLGWPIAQGMQSATQRRSATRASDVAGEAGFTIVEILTASFVLVVGMLAVLAVMTSTLAKTSANTGRVSATNLARELIEATRGLDYDDMTGTLVKTRLQAGGFGSGTPWTIERRSVIYTVTVASCTYDDPSDELAATPPKASASRSRPGRPAMPTARTSAAPRSRSAGRTHPAPASVR